MLLPPQPTSLSAHLPTATRKRLFQSMMLVGNENHSNNGRKLPDHLIQVKVFGGVREAVSFGIWRGLGLLGLPLQILVDLTGQKVTGRHELGFYDLHDIVGGDLGEGVTAL